MRNGFPTWLLLLSMLALAGCRRSELVENQLRARDIQYREALEEMMRTESINEDLRRENEALRAGQKLSPEVAAQTFGVRKIVIGRGTSGVDNDRIPGDEALQVWIEPRDASDHTIKAPGTLKLAVQEIDERGEKKLLSTWDIDADQLSKSWKQGLLSIGYMIQVPWKTPPRVETIRVIARFILPDGRYFEADKDLKVRLVPGAAQRTEAVPAPEMPDFRAAPPAAMGALSPVGHWTPAGPTEAKTQTGQWQSAPIYEAVELARPMPVFVPVSQPFYRPYVGEVRVED